MADRDQHPSREDEIRRAVFGQVDLQTAELEIVSSIYDGFAAAILVKGQPRTIALTREYGDAVQLMALIERGRSPQSAASEAGAAAGDPKGRRSIYDAAYDSIRKGAPGLSDATCAAIARSINLKVANGSASAEPGAIDEDWIRGLISEAVVMAKDQEREDESDEEICRIAESVLTAIRPYLRVQPPAREDAQPEAVKALVDAALTYIAGKGHAPGFGPLGKLHEAAWAVKRSPLYTHPAPDALRVAVEDIAAERQRQVDAEGWSAERDDEYTDRSLAHAAAAYALGFDLETRPEVITDDVSGGRGDTPVWRHREIRVPASWPTSWAAEWWKPSDARRDLVKAGALIVAEIERLDRAAQQAEGGA